MNKKINLEILKPNNCESNIKKEYKEYKEYKETLMNSKLNNYAKILEENIEKKWLAKKMPLLKRQYAFNESY